MRTLDRKQSKDRLAKFDPHITEDKLNELKKRLEKLKKYNRPQTIKEMQIAAQDGDFSENAAYQSAKGRLRGINDQILKLEYQIKKAVVIKRDKKSGKVQLGSTVKLMHNNKEYIYQILGSTETNPSHNIISHNSPIGLALMGHKVGDTVKIIIRDKEVEYKILEIK